MKVSQFITFAFGISFIAGFSYAENDICVQVSDKGSISVYKESDAKTCGSHTGKKNKVGNRVITEIGQKILVRPSGNYCLNVVFDEDPRPTNIKADIKMLLKAVQKIAGLESGEETSCELYEKTLVEKRANLKIEIIPTTELTDEKEESASDQGSSPGGGDTASKSKKANPSDKNSLLTYTLVTGPEEHLFLSADILVNKASQLKYDDETNSLKEKDKPTDFYLGLNYLVGDFIQTNEDSSASWDKVFLKAMIKFDRDPSDSYGLGVGYKFETFSVFVAYVEYKEDKLVDGTPAKNLGTGNDVSLGVSFNIDNALEWIP